MSSLYDQNGRRIAVTLLKYEDNQVISIKKIETHGYNSVVVGFGNVKDKKVKKPIKGIYAKKNIAAKGKIKEFRVSEKALLKDGEIISINHFVEGQYIDVSGKSIGKGFAGVMKRHNFRGLEATHGVSISHRSHGATGQNQDPGKVFKGKKMAGHLGCDRITMQNLKVIKVDDDNGIIIVKGAIPGHSGSYVEVRDAIKKSVPGSAAFPAAIVENQIVENE